MKIVLSLLLPFIVYTAGLQVESILGGPVCIAKYIKTMNTAVDKLIEVVDS